MSVPGRSKGSLSPYSATWFLFRRLIPNTLPNPFTLPPSTNIDHTLRANLLLEIEEGSGGSTWIAADASCSPNRICSRLPEVIKRLSYPIQCELKRCDHRISG